MPAINCKQCGGTVAPDADKCPHCGTENFDDNPIKMILKLAYIGLGLYAAYILWGLPGKVQDMAGFLK